MNLILSLFNPTTIKWVLITFLTIFIGAFVFITYEKAVNLNLENLEYKHKVEKLENTVKSQDAFIKGLMVVDKLKDQSVVEQNNKKETINKTIKDIEQKVNKNNVDRPASKLFKDLFKELEEKYGEK